MASLAHEYAAHVQIMVSRYEEAMKAADLDRVVVFAGVERMLPFDDSAYPFRATAHFRAWVPMNTPGHAIVFLRGERPRLFCHQPGDFWHAAAPAPPPMVQMAFDVIVADDVNDIVRQLGDGGRCAWLGEADHVPPACAHASLNPPALVRRLNFARSVKTDYELTCLRRANALGAQAHQAAAAAFSHGASEYQIHQHYLQAIDATDADLPYPSIVCLNEHAAILHYQKLDRRTPAEHRSFLIDAGAMADGYASDITRTYTTEREVNGPFATLLSTMDRLQQAVCDQVKAGVDYVELQLQCHEMLARVLDEAELINSISLEGAVEAGITRAFFPHGLGHYLGLQVHDVGGFQSKAEGGRIDPPQEHPFLRLTRQLREREVVTIEPGLYFIPTVLEHLRAEDAGKHVNWGLVEQLTPFGGIRIEDDVVALRGGHENLTRTAFATLAGH
ncbi:MAG: Xaa-Pro dipeptidase [Pseudomonadota bacterium]